MEAGKLFFSVFAVVFAAELPDKTALTSLVLATRYRPLPVLLGAGLALTLQSVVAVVAGSLLSKLPARAVRIGAGVLFLGAAILMWRKQEEAPDADAPTEPAGFWKVLWTAFAMVFVAEWGDLTQLATAGFAARARRPVVVFAAAAAALWSVVALAVFVGNRAGKMLNRKLTRRIAAGLFAAVGVALLTGIL